MGVTISSPSPLSPFSVISGIFGFIGFAFTIGTFLKVIGQNLETVVEAPAEIHEYLTALRQELVEEKRNVRLLRQRCKKRAQWRERQHVDFVDKGLGSFRGLELDDVSLKTTQDLVRRLIKEFKAIEQPFLAEGEDGIMGEKRHERHLREKERERDRSPYYDHAAYNGRPASRGGRNHNHNYNHSADEDDDEDRYWVQRVQYANLTFGRRYRWIWSKPKARQLFDSLSKLQIRRMSQQVAGIAILMHEQGNICLDLDEHMRRIDDRIGRLVGVRHGDS